MATGMPELGSKISLISKADIRYEGRLFTVDPSECTIALANVRSYGTEDRETPYPIAPQNLVYDYILFRGSDIKDIRVVNNVPTIPQDPAIMQMQMHQGGQIIGGGGGGGGAGGPMANGYPQQPQAPGFQQQQQQQQQQPMPMMNGGHMPAMAMGGYNAMGGLGGPLGPGGMGGLAPGANMSGLHKSKQTTSVLDLIGGSRSTTPVSIHSRKSPELGMQQQQQQPRNQQYHANNQPQQQQQQQNRGWNNAVHRGGPQQQQQQQNHQVGGNAGVVGGNNNNASQMRGQQRARGGRGPMNPGGGFRQSSHPQNPNSKPGNTGGGRPPKTTIKFEDDYDFEQANNKFEELRLELTKLKVGDDAKPEQQVNGEADKKDDSGNETGAGEHEQEDEEGNAAVCYDKTKSFFDSISCDAAVDRSKGRRTDWRHERKINSETFGVSARRGGFFRSRGGYYRNNNQNQANANHQGGNNGGNNGGFRQNNNNNGGGIYRQNNGNNNNNNGGGGNNNNGYRPRNFNNRSYQHLNQSTGIPVQPTVNKQQPAPQSGEQHKSSAAIAAN